MSGRLGFTLDSTNRTRVSRIDVDREGHGSLKKRTAKSLDYELDKARKDNQLLREASRQRRPRARS